MAYEPKKEELMARHYPRLSLCFLVALTASCTQSPKPGTDGASFGDDLRSPGDDPTHGDGLPPGDTAHASDAPRPGDGATVGDSRAPGDGCGNCLGFSCCGSTCVNLDNDIKNCGTCANGCSGAHPFCDGGTCGLPPCDGTVCADTSYCCDTQCCTADQICCDVPGPVEIGARCTAPDGNGSCPKGCLACVCAAPNTPIATPAGDVPIAMLKVGDLVFSVDHGAITPVRVREVHRQPVRDHAMVRVTLNNGETIELSPGHPTADGRSFEELRAGDRLGDVGVKYVETVAYRFPYTYDILPDSDSAAYFAAGALVGSTLR